MIISQNISQRALAQTRNRQAQRFVVKHGACDCEPCAKLRAANTKTGNDFLDALGEWEHRETFLFGEAAR